MLSGVPGTVETRSSKLTSTWGIVGVDDALCVESTRRASGEGIGDLDRESEGTGEDGGWIIQSLIEKVEEEASRVPG